MLTGYSAEPELILKRTQALTALLSNNERETDTDVAEPDANHQKLKKYIEDYTAAIDSLTTMDDKDKPFVPRSYKALQRNTFFILLSISLAAECLYFIFQEDTAEKGLSPYFPASLMWLCLSITYISATGDWDTNLWTISPRDDSDEHILTASPKSYTPLTLALIRLYYICGSISFPIGAAGGWLGLDKYSSEINDDASYLATNSLFFILLIPAGAIYYLAWCKGLADMTFKGINDYQKAERHDRSVSRYLQVAIEATSVTVYRSLGFGAIAGYIPAGFGYTTNKFEQKMLFSLGLASTFIVTLLTRPVKITNAWLSGLYAEVTDQEYATAARSKKLKAYTYIFDLKNLMSIVVGAGLAGFIVSSFEQPSSTLVIFLATIAALLPVIVTLAALRDLAILKIAVKNVGEEELTRRRNSVKHEDVLDGYEKRYALALEGFNALAAPYKEDKSITIRAAGASFLGRVARGSSFLYFTEDLSVINVVLNKIQQQSVAAIFAPHNLLNEYVAFRGGMVSYMSQKAAQAYIYHCISDKKDESTFDRWVMWFIMSGFRSFYYGKADFTPNELIHALALARNELHKQLGHPSEEVTAEDIILRGENQPKLNTFVETVCGVTQCVLSFFTGCSQDNKGQEYQEPLLIASVTV
ncbi:MAG: hypothetical protein KBD78_17190 [Oligoflexales bacterium]|nr:hypothetical protein [Oligoflexales bacterium]